MGDLQFKKKSKILLEMRLFWVIFKHCAQAGGPAAAAVTREEYIIDDDHIELDPTFHQESEEDVCDCFKSPEEDEKQCFEMMNV